MTKFFLLSFVLLQFFSLAQNYDAELISQETNIVINNNGLKKEVCFEIKINNRAGEKFTTITIPYSKLSRVSNINAYIKDNNGNVINKLDKSDIIEKSAISDFSFYEDDYVKEFTLKHNSYPYIINYSYQVQQNEFLYIDYWVPIIHVEMPTLSAKLNVTLPSAIKITYRNQFVKDPFIDTIGNMICYQWQTRYIDLIHPELFSPSIMELIPTVAITPDEFNFDKPGSFKDWVSYGNWQYELLQGLSELPDHEKSIITTLISDIKEDKEKIKILYHYLQDHTRYINITIETGGLKPYPATYVAENKYGDCKALTNYFKSIMDFIGVKSYYTKVHAGSPIKKINAEFPSQQFNHVILYIPCQNENIWLDCTSDGAFNYLGTFTQNRNAFMIDFNDSHFLQTPSLTQSEVLESRKIIISYSQSEADVIFYNNYKGAMYERLLNLEKSYNASEKSKILQNKIVDDGFQLIDYKISIPDRDSAQINLYFEATNQNIFNYYGNQMLISNIPFSVPQFEKPDKRKLPVQIDYPVYMVDTLIYKIPSGFGLNTKNFEHHVSTRFGSYEITGFGSEQEIIVTKNLLINPGYYSLSEYVDFFNFYIQIIDLENKTHLSLTKIN